MGGTTWARRRRGGLALWLTVVTTSVAACGGGGSSPTAPTPAPTQVTPPAPTDRSTQNPIGSATNVEARTSQLVGNSQPPTKVFDDFTFAASATIRRVGWQGIYCVERASDTAPAPTATAFVVSIHPDQNGQPNTGSTLVQTTVPVEQTAQALDRTQGNLTCGGTPTTWAFYQYGVTLPEAFTAVAGTKYWLSVQAVTPSYAVFWGWRDGTRDNASSVQLFNGQFTTFPVDRAFSLAP